MSFKIHVTSRDVTTRLVCNNLDLRLRCVCMINLCSIRLHNRFIGVCNPATFEVETDSAEATVVGYK